METLLISFVNVQDTYKSHKTRMCWPCPKESWLLIENLRKQEERLGRKGKLTNTMIERLQNYCGIAICSNKNNLKSMQGAAKAIPFHVVYKKENNWN